MLLVNPYTSFFQRWTFALAAVSCGLLVGCAESEAPTTVEKHPKLMSDSHPANRLADEKSPYLLQHAHNPVDWYPWGDEAFAKAKEENKLIFLSVGYSTCHWCHVMERESFENPATAKLMNENFVNIKVDREERPDVDALYMRFVQATTGQGGWPMSVWLTPELKPVVGGTYFPPVDAHGRAGFPRVLTQLANLWKTEPEKMIAQAEQVTDALSSHFASGGNAPGAIEKEKVLSRAYDSFAQNFDGSLGGFGAAPKFPRPTVLLFLHREYARLGSHTEEGRNAMEMSLATLDAMAAGGMHDHLGGASIATRSTSIGTSRITRRCFTIKPSSRWLMWRLIRSRAKPSTPT